MVNGGLTAAPVPTHWIGVRKHFLDECTSIDEAFVSVPSQRLAQHMLLLGKTGSGKTSAMLHFIAQDIDTGHSVIVLDQRGDLVNSVLEICLGRVPAERITLIDLRESDRILGFNPLHGKGAEYFRVLNLLDILKRESESWGVQLEETLRFALMLMARAQLPITLIERLLTNRAFRQTYIHLAKGDSEIGFWQRFDALSPERLATFVAPVLNKISALFATEGLRRMFGHQKPVDLGQSINEPDHVILISCALDQLHGIARLMGNLFLSAILREVFGRVEIPEQDRVPTRLYVDELHNFDIDNFESVLVECRRFKMPCFLATQSVVQLSPKMRTIVLGNVGAKLYFCTGREDSAALSKDLTGDSKAIDFTTLPVGDAVLWLQDQQPLHIECNAPLELRESRESQIFRAEIKNLIPPLEELRIEESAQSTIEPSSQKPSEQSLEDWL